ncbi:hypothetical protein BK704_13695 [[Bacillus thuringiensis] serovar konkukian]|nr:hypothetical protein [Bacillus thuringiensis]ANN35577.1 hypothetical protein A9498_29760 [Bacillus thuringiensis serovar coreanensis]MED1305039.1 hypothetical protein [Bacillus pacificus]OUB07556.1 hypothetical protein BK704_13695 [[Bacillus thuringiensis] serovar konkukian]
MGNKMQLECMDIECRTVMFGHFLDGMKCVNCGGPTRERPYKPVIKQIDQNKNRELTIKVNVDTAEALKQMKEVTEAANEYVAALEKLESVMGRFTNKGELKDMKVSIVLDRKVLAKSIVEQTTDGFKMSVNHI